MSGEASPPGPLAGFGAHRQPSRFEALNERYKEEVRSRLGRPVYFCGRLANYLYINQDQAIEQGFACSKEVLGGSDRVTLVRQLLAVVRDAEVERSERR